MEEKGGSVDHQAKEQGEELTVELEDCVPQAEKGRGFHAREKEFGGGGGVAQRGPD